MKLNKISADMVSRRPDQTAEWLNRLARQVDIVESQSVSGSKKPRELPIATTYSLGVVKIGQNLSITPEGVLSAMAPTSYNYELLFNKPKINNVELIGNKSLSDLGIDIPTKTSELLNDGSDGTSTYVELADLATVATSGAYADLSGKPTNLSDFNNDVGYITSADLPTKTSELQNDGSDGTSTYVETDELATVATSGSYNDLLNKPTIGNATLTIQKNGTSAGTFTANATSNKSINITVPTNTSDLVNDGSDGVSPFVDSSELSSDLALKQDKLIAGANIQIAQDGKTISATDTTYSAGNGLNLNGTTFSVDTSTIATQADITALDNAKQDNLTQAQLNAVNSGIDATKVAQIATNTGNITSVTNRVTTIEGKIPSAATSSNKLTDKNYVDNAISTNSANYISDNGQPFQSLADLEAYSGPLTNNDYAFVVWTDSAGNTNYTRYKYVAATQTWAEEYTISNPTFSSTQWAAIDSGVTANDVAQVTTNKNDIAGLQTSKQDKLTAAQQAAVDSGINTTKVTQITTNANNITNLQNNKQDKLSQAQLDAANSGITAAKVTKLDGIEAGAEVNVQADWNEASSSSDAYIKNKPTIGNATLTIQKNGTNVQTFTANATSNKTANITVPTKTSDVTNDGADGTSTYVENDDLTTALAGKQDVLTAGTNINIAANTISTQTRGIEYIVGTQASATNLWTGVSTDNGCSNGTVYIGKTIAYYLPVAGNNSAATLNLTLPDGTTTGEIPLRRTVSGTITTHFSAGNVIIFTYDGTYWKMSAYYDSNDNYNTRLYNASIKAAAAITSGRLCIGTSSGYKMIASGVESDIAYPILYAGSNVSVGSTSDNFYTIIRSINLQNTKSGWTGVATQEVWLVGTLSGSTFTVDSGVFTQTTPTTEDGKTYTPIGITYNTNAIFFCPSNVYWQYKNGEFRPISHSEPVMTGADADTAGTAGLVPAPAAGDNTKYLSGDGTWKTVSQYDLPIASASELGGVKIGSRLTINSSTGVLSADSQTDNNFTNTLKTKLDGIASGAEVNVQANWTEADSTSDAYIKNKPSLATVATSGSYNDLTNKPTIPTVNNATLTIQKNGTNVQTFTANQSTNATANIAVPTKTSDLNNDSNFVQSSSLATVATSGSYNDLTNKPTIPTVNNATLTIQRNGSNLQTFTANSSTNKTADIQAPVRVDMSSTTQTGSYRRSVIALCKVSTTNNAQLNSLSSGRVVFHRANGVTCTYYIDLQIDQRYSPAYGYNFTYSSNIDLLGETADIDAKQGFRPCVFKKNDVWYAGIEFYLTASAFDYVYFYGECKNIDVFGLDYYRVPYTSSGTTYPAEVLDQEVYDSLVYDTASKWNYSNLSAKSLKSEDGTIKKPGYTATLPNKTGTLAMTSDIPTVNNATLTIQKNGTSVQTFTANQATNATANITVPTKTSELTNDSGFVTDTTSQDFAAQEGSTNPVFDDMTPIKTFTWTVADTTYRPVYQFDNTGWNYGNMDITVAYRITVTGTGISQTTDIVDRWFSPGSWPVTSIMARTLSTSAATTGYRYLRAVYPVSAYLNNNTYKFGQEIAAYNSTPRTVKVEVFKTNSLVTWNETKPAGTIYQGSTYQTSSSLEPYGTRGWIFRKPANFVATSADQATAISDYERYSPGSSALKSGASALVAGHFAFLAEDGLVYDISNTAKAISVGESKVGWIASGVNANTAINQTYWRMISRPNATQYGYFSHDTMALGDRVYLRCTTDANGKIYSDNYLSKTMSAGYTWMPMGFMTAATTFYADTRFPMFYTLDSSGRLVKVNGKPTGIEQAAFVGNTLSPAPSTFVYTDNIANGAVTMDKVAKSEFLDFFYPVGSYYETSDVAFNPNNTWGGTWVEDTGGRVLVAKDSGTFSTVGDTGGSEYIQKHNHDLRWASYDGRHVLMSYTAGSEASYNLTYSSVNAVISNTNIMTGQPKNVLNNTDMTTGESGNLQPYIVIKRWHRTA